MTGFHGVYAKEVTGLVNGVIQSIQMGKLKEGVNRWIARIYSLAVTGLCVSILIMLFAIVTVVTLFLAAIGNYNGHITQRYLERGYTKS